jgi:hypothetical protein
MDVIPVKIHVPFAGGIPDENIISAFKRIQTRRRHRLMEENSRITLQQRLRVFIADRLIPGLTRHRGVDIPFGSQMSC